MSTDTVAWTWGNNGSGRLGDGTLTTRATPVALCEAGLVWRVATPSFSVAAGTYTTEKTVAITVATPGAEIHYTLTGADPTLADPVIASGGTVLITATATLLARAWKSGLPTSNLASATYTLAVSPPSISPFGGTYTSPRSVTMSTTTAGATIRYTTDGSVPTASSTAYTGAITIGTSTVVKAVGFKDGWSPSTVTTATFTMNFGTLTAPTISPAAGTYVTSTLVSLTGAAGTTIRYTLNGTTPIASSPVYTGPIELTTSTTVNAKAFHPDYTTSPMASAAYTIQAAAPVFAPADGAYPPGQLVTVTTATPSATITYTITGNDPTATDASLAPGGQLLAGNYVLKARTWKTGCAASDVTTATFAVTGAVTPPLVAAGSTHSLAVRDDAVVWAWGANGYGQLGDGTTTPRSVPGLVAGLTGIAAVAGGASHSLALRTDGTVVAWGYNGSGQLGDGTTTQRRIPVPVSGLANVLAIAAGANHSLALSADGRVWTWGSNTSGQLGDGTTTSHATPAPVPGLEGVTGIAAGSTFSLALTTDGRIWAWGANARRRHDDDPVTSAAAPVIMPAPPCGSASIARPRA